MKTRLNFLPFSDDDQSTFIGDGFIEIDFDTYQEAFDYMCYYATEIDFATIQIHGQARVEEYFSDRPGFLVDLVKKQTRPDFQECQIDIRFY